MQYAFIFQNLFLIKNNIFYCLCKSLQMKPETYCNILSIIDYGSNDDNLFEKNALESKNANNLAASLEIYLDSELFGKINYEDNKVFSNNISINNIYSCSSSRKNSLLYLLNETVNMVDFDKMQSSSPTLSSAKSDFFRLVL